MTDAALFAAAASLLRTIATQDPRRRVDHLAAYAENRAAEERAKAADARQRARVADERVRKAWH